MKSPKMLVVIIAMIVAFYSFTPTIVKAESEEKN